MQKLLAPNGKPSNLTPEQYSVVRTPEFKAWFGDWENDPKNASRVVDENGEPLVVYHYTDNKFNIFRLKGLSNGFFFTEYKKDSEFSTPILKSKQYFLNIKKLSELSEMSYERWSVPKYENEWIKKSKEDGANGIQFIRENIDFYDKKWQQNKRIIVAFEPNQIKLADGTNTTFDGNNPDIRFENGGLIAPNGKPSNLTPEQYKLVRTPAFKEWFGDWENSPETASKVVDENGEPLVCRHYSQKPIRFNEFTKQKPNDTRNFISFAKEGYYFSSTDKKSIEKIYNRSKKGLLYEVFLNVKNILDLGKYNAYDFTTKKAVNWKEFTFEMLQKYVIKGRIGSFDDYTEYNENVNAFWMDEIDEKAKNQILKLGYNGVWGDRDKYADSITDEFYGTDQIVVFEPTQIKLADGTNTTFDVSNPDIRFEEGGLVAPNGNPSNLTPEQYSVVRTPKFKAWFGDWENDPENASKVVDENGEPLVVYHGTDNEFTTFKLGYGSYSSFTENKRLALSYGHIVNSFFLSIKNPYIINGGGQYIWNVIGESQDPESFFGGNVPFSNDGIIFKDVIDFNGTLGSKYVLDVSNVIMVRKNTQIKLADGTNTTFDVNNPDIRFDNGGEVEDLISKGIVELKMFDTKPEHAKQYGLDSLKPLYVQTLSVTKNKRLQGIGNNVLQYIDDYAIKNGHDVVFGHITQKAEPNIDILKSMLIKSGFNTCEGNNDFYKKIDIRFENVGILNDSCDYFKEKTTGLSYYDDILNGKHNKTEYKIVNMPIDDYFKLIRDENEISYPKEIHLDKFGMQKEKVSKIIEQMNMGVKYDMPMYDFRDGFQEGRHRLIAVSNFGCKNVNVALFGNNIDSELNKLGINYIPDIRFENGGEIQINDDGDSSGSIKYVLNNQQVGNLNYTYDLNGVFSEELTNYNSEIYIQSIDVLKEFRGKGIATKLLQELIKIAKKLKVEVISLYRDSGIGCDYEGEYDLYLKRIYERIGFVENNEYCGMILELKNTNPDIGFKKGGRTIAQTPAPKKDQIKGSDKNKAGSSKDIKSAKSIKFSESTVEKLINKIDQHNEKYPNNKIDLATAKSVVRRGMGAYSSSHRPTISGGRPNSRVAWGIARLNAFIYKIINGKSKSGKYNQDDDLIKELGYKVKNYAGGGELNYKNGGEIDFPINDFIYYDDFTESLDAKLNQQATKYFSKKVTDDYWHFSVQYFNGEQITYEVYSEKGGFWLNFKIKNKNLVISSAKMYSIQKYKEGGEINTQYQERNIGGSDVYYKRENNGKWLFISKEEFDLNANNNNTILFNSNSEMDSKDTITMDVPLFIRMLEMAREDIKSDEQLHHVVENVLDLKDRTQTMDDYEYLSEPLTENYALGGVLNRPYARIYYVIWNDYIGNMELGTYNTELIGNEGSSIVQGAFQNMSDAYTEFFDYIKSEDGLYFSRKHPKSIWKIESRFYDGVSEDSYGYPIVKEKVLFKMSAKELMEMYDANVLKRGGQTEGGVLLAPNGKPSNLTSEQYKLVRTDAFKNWFGDWQNDPANASKVVDENGEPLVVYHGTKEKFTIFKDEGVVAKTMGKSVGFYFTPSKWSASRRSIDGDYIEVFLNIKKLFKLKKFSNDEDFIKILGNELKEAIGLPERAETYWYLKNGSGYDGREEYNVGSVVKELSLKKGIEGYYFLEFMSYDEGVVPVYQVFESKNVKLADGTNETFDGSNPDIRYADGGEISKNINKKLMDIGFNFNPHSYRYGKTIDEQDYITAYYDKNKGIYKIRGVHKMKTSLGENSVGIQFDYDNETDFFNKINEYLKKIPNNRLEEGGVIEGQLHSECEADDGCGEKFQVGDGGHMIEAERDEAVIVSKAFDDNSKYTIKGEPSEIASALNVLGGGKNFDSGATIITEKGEEMKTEEIKTEAKDTDVERKLESGSIIINRRSMADDKDYTVTGTPRQIASAINSINGNGVVIEDGAVIK